MTVSFLFFPVPPDPTEQDFLFFLPFWFLQPARSPRINFFQSLRFYLSTISLPSVDPLRPVSMVEKHYPGVKPFANYFFLFLFFFSFPSGIPPHPFSFFLQTIPLAVRDLERTVQSDLPDWFCRLLDFILPGFEPHVTFLKCSTIVMFFARAVVTLSPP